MKMCVLAFPFFIYRLVLVQVVILSLVGCNRVSGGRCIERERVALLDFKKSFVSALPIDKLSSWKSSSEEDDCCTWDGISCDNVTGHVVSLELMDQLLKSNQLRPTLLELKHLERLSLSWNDFSMKIPEFLASFSQLKHLDLYAAGFHGKIPPHLGNLSNLQTLSLGYNSLSSDDFEARDWLQTITKLPLLASFECSFCFLPQPLLPLNHVNSSTELRDLELSGNILSPSTLFHLVNITSKLSTLFIGDMYWEGPFPDIFHNMNALESLDISGNYIQPEIFQSIGNLSNLRTLLANQCIINQTIVGVIQDLTSFGDNSLEDLDLSSNSFTGTIPPILKFPSLARLDLSDNTLEPTLHCFPSSLTHLYLSSNSLQVLFSDAHFSNISNLAILDLSNNPNFTISFTMSLPQLDYILLSSCKLGPNFPSWLLSQKSYSELDISSCRISGAIPDVFWRNVPFNLLYLNISYNNFHGRVPNIHFGFNRQYQVVIDLSSNNFYGPIPYSLLQANILQLSNNSFSSIAPIPHSKNFSTSLPYTTFSDSPVISNVVDISDNCLSGVLPDWFWLLLTKLGFLSLANNNLSGSIPSSIQDISPLYVLVLSNNSFFGQLPLWLRNCTYLRLLDFSNNNFSGFLPSWVGENLVNMVMLSLGSNHLSGTLPTSLFHHHSLQIMNLSNNTLSGNIPSSVQNLIAMARHDDSSFEVWECDAGLCSTKPLTEASYYQAFIKWKGKDRLFKKTLQMVKLSDLSSNNLSGEIPGRITSLLGLNSLDLSNNRFNGSIPRQIGELKSLEVLKLCNNRLSGEIPSSLASIFSLDVLNVSHNKLSGKIPTSTQLQGFDPSAYAGNPELCGLPLPMKCPGDEEPSVPLSSHVGDNEIESKRFDMESFYGAMGFGFAFGFLVAIVTLSFIAKWRHAFFGSITHFVNRVILVVALSGSLVANKFHSG